MLSGCQNNTNELTYRNTKKEVTEVTNENETNVVDKTVNIKKMKFTEKQKDYIIILSISLKGKLKIRFLQYYMESHILLWN